MTAAKMPIWALGALLKKTCGETFNDIMGGSSTFLFAEYFRMCVHP